MIGLELEVAATRLRSHRIAGDASHRRPRLASPAAPRIAGHAARRAEGVPVRRQDVAVGSGVFVRVLRVGWAAAEGRGTIRNTPCEKA